MPKAPPGLCSGRIEIDPETHLSGDERRRGDEQVGTDCASLAIGGRLDGPTQQVIAEIPDAAWKHYADCAVAETLHSMNGTHKAFRLIVVQYNHQGDLFDDKPHYHVVASNRDEVTAAPLVWYRQRGETSENGIKELKIGFGMERMPCGQFHANAAFFRIGVIAHNLFVRFKQSTLDHGWQVSIRAFPLLPGSDRVQDYRVIH